MDPSVCHTGFRKAASSSYKSGRIVYRFLNSRMKKHSLSESHYYQTGFLKLASFSYRSSRSCTILRRMKMQLLSESRLIIRQIFKAASFSYAVSKEMYE